jgi:flagellar biosynthesis protein FlhG
VDGDLGLGKIDVMLGAEPRTNLFHYLAGRCELEEVFHLGPGGVVFLAGGWGSADLAVLDPLRRERLLGDLTRVAGIFDRILLDLATGIGPNALELAKRADEVLLVTTPEPTAYADAYALSKILFQATGTSPGFVLNRVQSEREARETYHRLQATARAYFGASPTYVGHLPEDPAVGRAIRQQTPFLLGAPRTPASRAIRKLARRVLHSRTPGGGNAVLAPALHPRPSDRAPAA